MSGRSMTPPLPAALWLEPRRHVHRPPLPPGVMRVVGHGKGVLRFHSGALARRCWHCQSPAWHQMKGSTRVRLPRGAGGKRGVHGKTRVGVGGEEGRPLPARLACGPVRARRRRPVPAQNAPAVTDGVSFHRHTRTAPFSSPDSSSRPAAYPVMARAFLTPASTPRGEKLGSSHSRMTGSPL